MHVWVMMQGRVWWSEEACHHGRAGRWGEVSSCSLILQPSALRNLVHGHRFALSLQASYALKRTCCHPQPKKVIFADEISTGLDSSTTYEIVKWMADTTHALNNTTLIALLQPAPETFDLFDDVILLRFSPQPQRHAPASMCSVADWSIADHGPFSLRRQCCWPREILSLVIAQKQCAGRQRCSRPAVLTRSEGYMVYHGPVTEVAQYFADMGFHCPERKGVADFLQEVTSKKDQAVRTTHILFICRP